MAKVTIELPDELLNLRQDIEGYIASRILPPLIQELEELKKKEVLDTHKNKIKKELNDVQKNITITLDKKAKPAENTTFPVNYVPPDEGKNDVKNSSKIK